MTTAILWGMIVFVSVRKALTKVEFLYSDSSGNCLRMYSKNLGTFLSGTAWNGSKRYKLHSLIL